MIKSNEAALLPGTSRQPSARRDLIWPLGAPNLLYPRERSGLTELYIDLAWTSSERPPTPGHEVGSRQDAPKGPAQRLVQRGVGFGNLPPCVARIGDVPVCCFDKFTHAHALPPPILTWITRTTPHDDRSAPVRVGPQRQALGLPAVRNDRQ